MLTQTIKIGPTSTVHTHGETQSFVAADKALPHTTYRCPLCGTDLYLAISKNGIRHFRCYPLHPHTKKFAKTRTKHC